MKPDLLYIVGTGSQWANNELRYSLRSAAAFYRPDRVYVVGHLPDWVAEVTHIPAQDVHGPNKLANSVHKLTVALRSPLMVSSNLAIMNDDFFFLAQHSEIPYRHRGTLLEAIRQHPTGAGYYATALRVLYAELVSRGVQDPVNYGLHYPFPINVELAKRVLESFSGFARQGYLFRTAYGNFVGAGGEQVPDYKQKGFRWQEPPAGTEFISTDDVVVNNRRFQEWIARMFKTKCRYEQPDEQPRTE